MDLINRKSTYNRRKHLDYIWHILNGHRLLVMTDEIYLMTAAMAKISLLLVSFLAVFLKNLYKQKDFIKRKAHLICNE